MVEARTAPEQSRARGASVVSTVTHALPDAWYCRASYLLGTKRILHLKNPRTYSEKIQWLKVYGHLERYAPYVDKYEVREYIKDVIGVEYLVPILGVWSDFDDIRFDELPSQFVLKATHGQGFNVICRDKSSLDLSRLRATVTSWTKRNYYQADREPQYRPIRPRLIAEEYLQDESGALRDYKFPCFDGVPYMVQVMGDRRQGTTENLYDRDWHLLPVLERGYPNTRSPIMKPALLDDMFDIAASLSSGFPFVRVDLYCVGGRIYFGELTFTPASGVITYEPPEFDLQLGNMLDLAAFNIPTN
jgi:TupA-like ATPgrasp